MIGINPFAQSVVWRYSVAIVLASVGVLLRYFLDPILQHDVPILFSMITVFIAAWYCGVGPGIAATVLSTLGGFLLFVSPWDGNTPVTAGQFVRLGMFLATGGLVSGLSEAVRRATLAWHRAEQDKERLILEERNRLAREIHDTLAQGLTGIILQLEAAEDNLSEGESGVREHLYRARDLARHSLTEARRSVQSLRSEQRDLAASLSYYIRQMTEGTGLDAQLNVEGEPTIAATLPANAQSELLRIGLEAVTNAVKHAGAETIRVTLTCGAASVRLTVRDDGRRGGASTTASGTGFGLIAMQERARQIGASFAWTSDPRTGTEVIVTVPLAERKEVSV